jgi:hypothetical protein
MTSDSTRPPDKRYGYSNALSGLVNLVREEGIRGLARGLGANTVRAVLMNVSNAYYSLLTTHLYDSLDLTSRIVSGICSSLRNIPHTVTDMTCSKLTSYDTRSPC